MFFSILLKLNFSLNLYIYIHFRPSSFLTTYHFLRLLDYQTHHLASLYIPPKMFLLTTPMRRSSTLRVLQAPVLSQTRLYRTNPRLQNTLQDTSQIASQEPTTDNTHTNPTVTEQKVQLPSRYNKESLAAAGKQACYDGLFDVWLLASLSDNRFPKNNSVESSTLAGHSACGFSSHYPKGSLNNEE